MDESDTSSRPSRRRHRDRRRLTDERRQEIHARGWRSIEDVPLTADHVEFFREAGASEVFLTLIQADPEDYDPNRNVVRHEARRCIFYGDLDGNPEDFTHEGGRFFTKLWDGDLYEVFRHEADLTQAPLMESVFGEDRINADRPHADAPKVSELDSDRFFTCVLPLPPEMQE